VPPDAVEALTASKSAFISQLFARGGPPDGSPKRDRASSSGGKKLSLGAQFRNQLHQLTDRMRECAPHFVRCVKTNKPKKPSLFEGNLVLRQLRYSGLLEVCRVRRAGFPWRLPRDGFVRSYGVLAPLLRNTPKMSPEALFAVVAPKLGDGQMALGKTTIFLKSKRDLDDVLDKALVNFRKRVRDFLGQEGGNDAAGVVRRAPAEFGLEELGQEAGIQAAVNPFERVVAAGLDDLVVQAPGGRVAVVAVYGAALVGRDHGRAMLEQQSEGAFMTKPKSPNIGRAAPEIWIGARCEKHFQDRSIFMADREKKRCPSIRVHLIHVCARIYEYSDDVRVVTRNCNVKRCPTRKIISDDVRAPG
jgi:hypothetical protein